SYVSNDYLFGYSDGTIATLPPAKNMAQPTARYPASFGARGASQTILFAESWAVIGSGATAQYRHWAPNHAGSQQGNHVNMVTQGKDAVEFDKLPNSGATFNRVNLSAVGGQVGLGDGSVRFVTPSLNATFPFSGHSTVFNWAASVPTPGQAG